MSSDSAPNETPTLPPSSPPFEPMPPKPPVVTVRRITVGFKSGKEQTHTLHPKTSTVADQDPLTKPDGFRMISTATTCLEMACAAIEYWFDQTIEVKEPPKKPPVERPRRANIGPRV